MLVCENAELVPWRPDFSPSEQASPLWTRLTCRGEQLANGLEGVEWFGEPAVQVELCESCGFAGCSSGGYVHVSRVGRYVLWTAPHVDPDDPFEASQYGPSEPVRRYGGVAIPADEWERWRGELAGLPRADDFPRTTRRDLDAAWHGEAPIFREFDHPTQLVQLVRERAVAADPSGLDEALGDLGAVALWLSADPDVPVDGELRALAAERTVAGTIYLDVPDTFDRPGLREWSATARLGGQVAPVFGGELVLVGATI